MFQPKQNNMEKLSKREKEILKELAFGSSTKEIAEKQGIARWTVVNHIRKIYDKLGVARSFNAITAYYFCYTYKLKADDGSPLTDKITKDNSDKDAL